jgi:hypothetical protein
MRCPVDQPKSDVSASAIERCSAEKEQRIMLRMTLRRWRDSWHFTLFSGLGGRGKVNDGGVGETKEL